MLSYPVSIRPACWLLARINCTRHARLLHGVHDIYSPILPVLVHAAPPVRRAMMWWMVLGTPRYTTFHSDWDDGVGWSNPGHTCTLAHYGPSGRYHLP